MSDRSFEVVEVDYATGVADLRTVREQVFVQEQGVPLALEWDDLDPASHHVIARDAAGDAIGTAVAGEGIEMLVMGAYGHSRIRNLIIGSTTFQNTWNQLAPSTRAAGMASLGMFSSAEISEP